VDALNSELAGYAPMLVTDPAKAIYRIYRDTRFSSDKTPYKTQIAASFWHRGLPKHAGAGLYVAVSADGVDVGGGVYMPGPEELLALRTLIAADWEIFQQLDSNRKVRSLVGELHGEELSRAPKGFPAGHPAEAMLRKKQWYYFVTLDPALAASPKLLSEVVKRFKVMLPTIEFLNTPLLAKYRKRTQS
jgi:uncharacterized protein (TIGR02453 family)